MYSKELKDIITHLDKTMKQIQPGNKIIKEYRHLIDSETDFLPDNSPFYERIYCIKNNIFEIPKCQVCGNPTKMIRNGGFHYPPTCSLSCARKVDISKRSQETTDKMNKLRLKTLSNRTQLEKNKAKKKYEKTWNNRTQEQQIKTNELHNKNWEEKSQEERDIVNQRKLKGMKKRHKTGEIKIKKRKITSNTPKYEIVKCLVCGNEYDGFNALSKHIKKFHSDIDLKTYYLEYLKKEKKYCLCEKECKFKDLRSGYRANCGDEKCIPPMSDKARNKMSKTKRDLYNNLKTSNPSDKNCYLYLISNNQGLIKIGVSLNPEKRLKGLKCAFHKNLQIIDKYFGNFNKVYTLETKLHHKYDKFNVILPMGVNGRTEWFEDEILKEVKQDFKNFKKVNIYKS